jgi:hypothetical protein
VKYVSILFALVSLIALCACSGPSTLERANLTTVESRQDYIKLHPEGVHNDCIRNGEIVPGMNVHEVIASWGLPNVYVVTRTEPTEEWIYYLKDRDSLSMLIYTLTFASDTLQVWSVDQKRFVGQGVVSREEALPATPTSTSGDLKTKK